MYTHIHTQIKIERDEEIKERESVEEIELETNKRFILNAYAS